MFLVNRKILCSLVVRGDITIDRVESNVYDPTFLKIHDLRATKFNRTTHVVNGHLEFYEPIDETWNVYYAVNKKEGGEFHVLFSATMNFCKATEKYETIYNQLVDASNFPKSPHCPIPSNNYFIKQCGLYADYSVLKTNLNWKLYVRLIKEDYKVWDFAIYFDIFLSLSRAQDYDVNDVQCSFSTQASSVGDLITAKLKKPVGFKGSPLFADERNVDPEIDYSCAIKPDLNDPTELSYDLRITDFSRCGVLKRNGFVHVRIWFPQFPGVVMQSDQELIIMCKPPEPTVIQNKAAGFAGSFPHGARVSGVVEETPGRLEYEVALYKEAPPIAKINGNLGQLTSQYIKNVTSHSMSINEVPVDQAVPIGTKLQLRARISTQSVWKYVKLMEVTVSPDPDDPHSLGAVLLVKEGCRNRDFASIIPHQPARYRDKPNEVFLDFEAFLLSSMKERSTLWIHSQIKACMDATDCQPDFCLDLYEPAGIYKNKQNALHGHGKRRKRQMSPSHLNTTDYTKFKENIEYTVIMPREYGDAYRMYDPNMDQCRTFIMMSGIFGFSLVCSIVISCFLVLKLQNIRGKTTLEDLVSNQGYAGRAIVQ